jgi:hypothetical protein
MRLPTYNFIASLTIIALVVAVILILGNALNGNIYH